MTHERVAPGDGKEMSVLEGIVRTRLATPPTTQSGVWIYSHREAARADRETPGTSMEPTARERESAVMDTDNSGAMSAAAEQAMEAMANELTQLGVTSVVLPEVSDDPISDGLRELTRVLVDAGVLNDHGGGLGGEFGYGVDVDTETFMMHHFCWCEQAECPWCRSCVCDLDSYRYEDANGIEVPQDEFFDRRLLSAGGDMIPIPERQCVTCTTNPPPREPNFRHKATGSTITWYKWIGRSMEIDLLGDWDSILAECLAQARDLRRYGGQPQ